MKCCERLFGFKQKEVININDGCRLGFICDIEIDVECGRITKIIVEANGKLWGIISSKKEYVICWDNIVRIGSDIILVDINEKEILKNEFKEK